MSNEIMGRLRAIWRGTIESGGGHCPVCDRWGRVYSRPINRTMARSLMWLAYTKHDTYAWVDVANTAPRWVVQSNQLSTLRWWGLIERKPNEGGNNTKHSGVWRLTDKGFDFVHHSVPIPKHVFTYNDTVQGYGIGTVTFKDCFIDNFDYNAIMSSCMERA